MITIVKACWMSDFRSKTKQRKAICDHSSICERLIQNTVHNCISFGMINSKAKLYCMCSCSWCTYDVRVKCELHTQTTGILEVCTHVLAARMKPHQTESTVRSRLAVDNIRRALILCNSFKNKLDQSVHGCENV